jgi:hypothetical protein
MTIYDTNDDTSRDWEYDRKDHEINKLTKQLLELNCVYDIQSTNVRNLEWDNSLLRTKNTELLYIAYGCFFAILITVGSISTLSQLHQILW